MRFYLTDQRTFGNCGCEAIVRSTVAALKQELGDIEVLAPSNDIECDSAQWPEAVSCALDSYRHAEHRSNDPDFTSPVVHFSRKLGFDFPDRYQFTGR